jgi:hypothetical protein
LAEDEEPEFSAQLTGEGSCDKSEGVYVSLSQSQPAGFDYAFRLNSGGQMYFFFRR